MYDGSRQHASFAHKFTGKERDAESGLDNFEARYLGSSLGRFMSPDPMGGHLQDPQTLNRYAYVRNNPLSLTDPTGLDFYLSCQHTDKNGDVCQQQQVGTDSKGNAVNAWVQGASDDNGKFTATQIGNNPDGSGGLIDKTTGTGSYTGTFDGQNVTFTNAEGKQSTGDWVQGTDKTSGIAGGGDLGNRFQFTFMDHGADQTLNFDFQFHGTRDLAESILERAGYKYWSVGRDIGYDEYRLPAEGQNSTHFLVSQSPRVTVPSAKGSGHVGEYYPGFDHFWHDILHQ